MWKFANGFSKGIWKCGGGTGKAVPPNTVVREDVSDCQWPSKYSAEVLNQNAAYVQSCFRHFFCGDGDWWHEHHWRQSTKNGWHWTRPNRCNMWSRLNHCHFLEAISWGAAVLVGIQYSHIYYRHDQHDRSVTGKPTWFQTFRTTHPLKWLRLLHDDFLDSTAAVRNVLPRSGLSLGSSEEDRPDAGEESTSPPTVASQWSTFDELHDLMSRKYDEFSFNESSKSSVVDDDAKKPETPVVGAGVAEAVQGFEELNRRCVGTALNSRAVGCVSSGNYTDAVELWRLAIEQSGYEKALFNLALCYEEGLDVERNIFKAAEFYSLAASKGHRAAMYNLACLYLRNPDQFPNNVKETRQLLEQAARLGVIEAMRELAVMLMNDKPADHLRAVKLFKVAAKHKDTNATYFLGICYQQGVGVAKDVAMAIRCYQEAANAGHHDALHNLTMILDTQTEATDTVGDVFGSLDDRRDELSLLRGSLDDRDDLSRSSGSRHEVDKSQSCQSLDGYGADLSRPCGSPDVHANDASDCRAVSTISDDDFLSTVQRSVASLALVSHAYPGGLDLVSESFEGAALADRRDAHRCLPQETFRATIPHRYATVV